MDRLQQIVCAGVLLMVGGVAPAERRVDLPEAPAIAEDHHAVIAITCPYAPYFGLSNGHGTEWALIDEALAAVGRDAQHLYVTYEEGVRYTEADFIAGVWICGGMKEPENGFYSSVPLLERDFVVVTLESNELVIDSLETLSRMSVAIHPDVYRVLEPQLGPLPDVMPEHDLQKIANHLLLASLLTTGKLDAVITERAVFDESLKHIPKAADPAKSITYHALFEPVAPRILFKDQALRDDFDKAWQQLTGQGGQ
jgi:hypothetical protein